jgi:hypothetical protein
MRSVTRRGYTRLAVIAVAAPATGAICAALAASPAHALSAAATGNGTAAGRAVAQVSTAAAGRLAATVAAGSAAGTTVDAASSSWRLLATQRPAHGGHLSVLVALPHGDAWAFGVYGMTVPYGGHPLAEYWNGKAWSVAALPASVLNCGPVVAAGASSAGNVWAVGWDGCVLRLTGRTWKVARDFKVTGQLTGITVLGTNNVWVFGGTGLPAGRPGLGTWHYNGKTWQQEHGIGGDVQTASAASARDIWAIGVTVHGLRTTSFLEHYNGQTWQRVSGVGEPYSVLAAGTQVWALDRHGTSGELLRKAAAGRWVTVSVPGKIPPLLAQLATTDGGGGIWLTSWASVGPSSPSVRNIALHRSGTGKWAIKDLTTGALQLALSRIPGTTSMLALGETRTGAALFGYGKS